MRPAICAVFVLISVLNPRRVARHHALRITHVQAVLKVQIPLFAACPNACPQRVACADALPKRRFKRRHFFLRDARALSADPACCPFAERVHVKPARFLVVFIQRQSEGMSSLGVFLQQHAHLPVQRAFICRRIRHALRIEVQLYAACLKGTDRVFARARPEIVVHRRQPPDIAHVRVQLVLIYLCVLAHQRQLFFARRPIQRRFPRVAERLCVFFLACPSHLRLVGKQLVPRRIDALKLVHGLFVRGQQALHQRQLCVAAQRARLLHLFRLRSPCDHLRQYVAAQFRRERIALHRVVQRLDFLSLRSDASVGHHFGHVVADQHAPAVFFGQRADHPPGVGASLQHSVQLVLARALDAVILAAEQRPCRFPDGLRLHLLNFRISFIRARIASLFEGLSCIVAACGGFRRCKTPKVVSRADGRSCRLPFLKAHPALRDDLLFRGHLLLLNRALNLFGRFVVIGRLCLVQRFAVFVKPLLLSLQLLRRALLRGQHQMIRVGLCNALAALHRLGHAVIIRVQLFRGQHAAVFPNRRHLRHEAVFRRAVSGRQHGGNAARLGVVAPARRLHRFIAHLRAMGQIDVSAVFFAAELRLHGLAALLLVRLRRVVRGFSKKSAHKLRKPVSRFGQKAALFAFFGFLLPVIRFNRGIVSAGGRRRRPRNPLIGLVQRRRQLRFGVCAVFAFLDLLPRVQIVLCVLLLVRPITVKQALIVVRLLPVFALRQIRAFQKIPYAVRALAVKAAARRLGQRFVELLSLRAQIVVRNRVDAAHHRRRVGRVHVDALPVKPHQVQPRKFLHRVRARLRKRRFLGFVLSRLADGLRKQARAQQIFRAGEHRFAVLLAVFRPVL